MIANFSKTLKKKLGVSLNYSLELGISAAMCGNYESNNAKS